MDGTDMSLSIDKLVMDIYLNVIFNWNSINQNVGIREGLCMKNNSMCKYYKMRNPTMRDSFIQAHVLTMLIMLFIIIQLPIGNVFDEDGDANMQLMYDDSSVIDMFDENDILEDFDLLD